MVPCEFFSTHELFKDNKLLNDTKFETNCYVIHIANHQTYFQLSMIQVKRIQNKV